LNCLSSYSLDTSITGESPSAAPTETSSPSCPPCVDNKIWRYASVDNQGCEWIGLGRENNRDRCTLPWAKTRCPVTCGQCRPGATSAPAPGVFDETPLPMPNRSPTPACRNLDENCEPILIKGVMTSLCTHLETLSKGDRNNLCFTKNYKSLKQKESACTYLQSSYPQAYNKQCDPSGRFIGNTHKSGGAVVTIAYSEICGKTCGVC